MLEKSDRETSFPGNHKRLLRNLNGYNSERIKYMHIIYIHIYVYILSEIDHSIFLHVRILNVHCKVSLHFYVNIVNRD